MNEDLIIERNQIFTLEDAPEIKADLIDATLLDMILAWGKMPSQSTH